jgi:hypothetical protein
MFKNENKKKWEKPQIIIISEATINEDILGSSGNPGGHEDNSNSNPNFG